MANAVLFLGSGDSKISSQSMINFCKCVAGCKLLFRDFDGRIDITQPCHPCLCCDICKSTCGCEKCVLLSYALMCSSV